MAQGDFSTTCIPLLTSHFIPHVDPSLVAPSSPWFLIGIWHVYPSCLGKSGTFLSENGPYYMNQHFFTSLASGGFSFFTPSFSCPDLFPWKPLASDSILLPGDYTALKPIKPSFFSLQMFIHKLILMFFFFL